MVEENNTIDTILFDLDGTLINSMDLIIDSFLHTMDTYFPNQYNREDVISFIGPPLSETFTKLDADLVEDMTHTYRTFNNDNHDKLVTEYEGVKETLEILYENGYKLAIVTSKRRETAIRGLRLMGLVRFFPVIVSIDEVSKYKPDPEPLTKALEGLHSTPEQAIMIGDSEHDILGGINTGTKTAGVAWSIKGREYIDSFQPDVILETMPDLLDYLGVKGKRY